jgi:glycosyltransferase involved in cell wall biosynthesis
LSISVLILTLNEEINLPSCLASVAWSDDIVVLDSFSTDRTVETARAAGARVFQRCFDNERNQLPATRIWRNKIQGDRSLILEICQFASPW